jgi:hypothetical protein
VRTPAVVAMLATACTLGACGKSDIAIVTRPVVPIWVCKNDRHERPNEEQCEGRFDAGSLIGLTRSHAEKVAEEHGYDIRCEAGVGPKYLTREYSTGRLDVECLGDSNDPIVVRFIQRG